MDFGYYLIPQISHCSVVQPFCRSIRYSSVGDLPTVTGKPLPMTVFWSLVGICVLLAGFLVWRDEHRKAVQLEERLKPKIEISRTAQSFLTNTNGDSFFSAQVDNLGEEPVRDVEAYIREIRRDGKLIKLEEVPQLRTHKGLTIPVLSYKIPCFVDVIRTESGCRC
jgi:hypothetical protein